MEKGDVIASGAGGNTSGQVFPAGLRVLFVEDDPACLEELREILERCRYTVTAKASPAEALREVEENPDGFDIVMTVVHAMGAGPGGFDGFKLLERIKDRYPVILFSTDYSKKMVMRGVNEGACDFITKPMCYQEMRLIWMHVKMGRMANGSEENDSDGSQQGSNEIEGCSNNVNPPEFK